MPNYIDKDALLHKLRERHEDLARDYGDYDNYVMGFGDAIELLARYVNEYIALCIVYGAERAREILQERHEGSKDNGILLDSNQQQI